MSDPETIRYLIDWGKTLCLPHRTDVEYRVWQMANTLEALWNHLEKSKETQV